MKTIKILNTTVCGGEVIPAGEIVDASDRDARLLVNLGKAVEAERPKPKRRVRRAPTNRQISAESLENR